MFKLDKLVFAWIYDLCVSIGSFFGVGILGGAFCVLLFFGYAYTISNKRGK
ncbi:hypothetical protein [Clostridium sp.]|uniref:hypothetical protein n=1 Tax=Clostridium sp. TaxID=1506 RepID=UPI001B5A3DB5|nr:hypothetical protein [Clostridium sp.]MBP3915929.1 hypothetical protein [Clostridium sp.]